MAEGARGGARRRPGVGAEPVSNAEPERRARRHGHERAGHRQRGALADDHLRLGFQAKIAAEARRIPPPARSGDADAGGLPAPTINSALSSRKPCARPSPYTAAEAEQRLVVGDSSRPRRSLALSWLASVAVRVLRFTR